MNEIIIIETNRPQKIKNFLNQEKYPYKIYQEPKTKRKVNIFANYGEAAKNKERGKEVKLWDNVDLDEELNNDGEWWS